ncbi:hypothetical protein E2C01_081028 [Portunus trituberculatus]|uniref:Uncharacterized protein n=1 Tax=Portunus trituberculatus TaxID=210409 RepID=A0A5B7INS0_PORTR|nr:hypothetical protein [Portunus trituberculatus]
MARGGSLTRPSPGRKGNMILMGRFPSPAPSQEGRVPREDFTKEGAPVGWQGRGQRPSVRPLPNGQPAPLRAGHELHVTRVSLVTGVVLSLVTEHTTPRYTDHHSRRHHTLHHHSHNHTSYYSWPLVVVDAVTLTLG